MALPVLYERVSSREFSVARDSASFTAEFIAVGGTSEADVYQSAILNTPISYLGLYRSKVDARPRGNNYWDVTIAYESIPADEAVGEQEPGEGPQAAESPGDEQALGSGYSFSTLGGTTHITQSLATISKTTVAPFVAPDFKQAIGVTLESVEGCDIVTPNCEFSRDVRRNGVTLKYWRILRDLTGTTNSAKFYGHEIGEVLYLGCEGKYQSGEGWSLTHRFAVNKNRVNIVISDEITVPAKKGWEYLWVDYVGGGDQGRKIRKPRTAVVERVYDSSNFALLEIGT